MPVLIGTRSLHFRAKAMRLEIAEKTLWTDSQCLLQWIKNRENTSIFVRNRVTEIINETDVVFRYINTKHSPADIPTRGMSINELKNNKLWWYGPEWLLQDPNEWPQWNARLVEANSESVSEERGKKHVILEVSGTAPDEKKVKVRKLFEIDEARYSSFTKLLKVTAYVNRFINYMKNKRKIDNDLTGNEINRAEQM